MAANNQAVAKLIAENLHNLQIPGPNGQPIRYRLLSHSTVGQSPEMADKINRRAYDIGLAITHHITNAGYQFVHPSDPDATDNLGPYLVATAYCAHCANPIHTLTNLQLDPARPDHFTAKLYRQGIEAIGHNHRCWD
ncbi:hypothetical protein JF780_05735 [Mycobacterium intracellulare]|uniref:hypothetical protein n=1 Tax=Mycobacterium intracellulare TaxID=1767 RepID=UPI001CD9D3E1|nr:hypothetical protein [Mycobacterium intracellulare]MCA2275492.1 hypothetical protein [Mycobacterium intracellulare]MCA2324452.1 hypothetical protein [Mycobacterium intracellulare]